MVPYMDSGPITLIRGGEGFLSISISMLKVPP